MEDGAGDIYHLSRDEEYLSRVTAEAEFFDRPSLMGIDVGSPLTDAYFNERFTGDKNVAWFETIPRYGTFRRGCALGAGGPEQRARILEQNPGLHLTVHDVSEESLATLERRLAGRFPDRVTTKQADLNFVELPDNAYDIIISSNCFHHLSNLEHVAYQVNKSLTADGFFFLTDYVGEARFQFAEEKKRVLEAALRQAAVRRPVLRSWQAVWPDAADWTYSPFEAVRSDETLEVHAPLPAGGRAPHGRAAARPPALRQTAGGRGRRRPSGPTVRPAPSPRLSVRRPPHGRRRGNGRGSAQS